MRLTSFILLVINLHVNANVYSQKVSVHSQDISLEKVFNQLNQQTGYSFFWKGHLLDSVRHLNIWVRNVSLEKAIESCLAGTSLSYNILEKEKAVFITPAEQDAPIHPGETDAPDSLQILPARNVQGSVKDSTGKPIEAASVVLRNGSFSKGTATDKEGRFILKAIPDGSYMLEITSVGYARYQRMISINSAMAELDITLSAAVSFLDETVVIGYGTEKRRELTASVATVDMSKVAEIASPSINDEMGGRMPGVFVASVASGNNTGGPGVQASIFVRGGNGGNNPPLFIIDGFMRTSTDYLNINPNDVESFVVLKDAEATAVYGSQGANGVILVNTKKGSYGAKPVFNYTFNQIWTQPTTVPKMESSYQTVTAINQTYTDLGLAAPYADSVVQHYKNQDEPFVYPNTNWWNLVFNKFAEEDRHDFSVSAGNENLRYYGGLSYYHQGSLTRQGDAAGEAQNNRVTYRLSVENNIRKVGLKITAGLDGYVNSNNTPDVGSEGYYGLFSNVMDHSSYQVAENQYGLPYIGVSGNPLMNLGPQAGYQTTKQTTFNGLLGLDWQLPFFKDIHLKANGNFNMYNTVSREWTAVAPGYDLNSTTPLYSTDPNLIQTNGDGNSSDLQGMITYNHVFGKNHVAFTGVYEQIKTATDAVTAERQSYLINDPQFFVGPTVNQSGTGTQTETGAEGYVGRLQYNYNEKYFLEGSLRYDGSYLFPPNKRYGLFYGVSAGWIPTDEKFLQFLKDDHILDYLKVRGSYGLVGNTNGVTPYEYLPLYSAVSNAYVVNGVPQIGLASASQLPSTNFTWYSNSSTNIGIDFAAFHSRLSGSFDYFYYTTKGFVISDTTYATTLGQSLPYVNSPGLQRTAGEEFGLNWDDHVGALKYHIGITFSHYATLYPVYPGETATEMEYPLTRQSGKEDNYYNFSNAVNGASAGFNSGLGYTATGLYGSNAAVLNGALLAGSTKVAGGDIQYKDLNGDGQINSSDESLVGANNFAHANYGLNIGLDYKGWSLDAAFMESGNRDMELGEQQMGEENVLAYADEYNYWTPANTGANLPRALPYSTYNGGNNTANSTYWLVSARYFRLKSLNIGYDLKAIGAFRRVSAISRFKLFVTGRNLFTLSNTMKYYIDPESNQNGWGYPVQRTFAVGCNVGF